MPITITERPESRRIRSGLNPMAEFVYMVVGSNDPLQAKAIVAATAPPTFDLADGSPLLIRGDVDHEPVPPESYLCTVPYEPRRLALNKLLSFSSKGGTLHVSHAPLVRAYPTGAIDYYNGLIGVNGDQVEGVDIVMPGFTFQVDRLFTSSQMTNAYLNALEAMSACVNDRFLQINANGLIRSFNMGELLFVGAEGRQLEDGTWSITYEFAKSRGFSGRDFGPRVGLVDKLGWDYLWIEYEDDIDDLTSRKVKVPGYVYVHRIYDFANLAALGL